MTHPDQSELIRRLELFAACESLNIEGVPPEELDETWQMTGRHIAESAALFKEAAAALSSSVSGEAAPPDASIQHTHTWAYNWVVNAMQCRCHDRIDCDHRLPRAIMASYRLFDRESGRESSEYQPPAAAPRQGEAAPLRDLDPDSIVAKLKLFIDRMRSLGGIPEMCDLAWKLCCENERLKVELQKVGSGEAASADRLRALARIGALEKHNGGMLIGHRGDFATCPHPDCVLVRGAASTGTGKED